MMAQEINKKEIVTFQELLMANSIQVDALAQLMIEKGLITEQDFYRKLKKVQKDYKEKSKT